MCRAPPPLLPTPPSPSPLASHAAHAPPPPPPSPCSYSVFTVISIHIPAKITGSTPTRASPDQSRNEFGTAAGDNPVVIHIEAAIDNANENEHMPLAPWH